jgi:hypothetical protein
MEPAVVEKRRDTRVNYDLPVFFFFARGKRRPRNVRFRKGFTQDISRNGVRLLIEYPDADLGRQMAEGAEIEMELYLPLVFRSKPIVARGTVVWYYDEEVERKPCLAAGVDFTRLSDSDRETLKTVADRLRLVTDQILGDEGVDEADGRESSTG